MGYRARLAALRGNRNFRLLWFAQAGSDLGTAIATLAGPLLAMGMTGSPVMAGLVGTVGFTAMWLTYVPAGYVADMFDRRKVMLWCDGIRAIVIGAFVVGLLSGTASVWWLLVVVAATCCVSIFFNAAETQAIRQIVARDQLPEAISVTQARGYAVELVGPLAGGALFGLARWMPFLADAISYVFSWLCVSRIRGPLAPESRPNVRRLLPDVGDGWAFLWRDTFVRTSTIYSITTNVVVSMLLYILIIGYWQSSAALGASVGFAAGAGLVGSLVAPAVAHRMALRTLLVGVSVIRGGLLLAAAWSGNALMFAAVVGAVVFLGPITRAALGAATMIIVPGQVLGRVQGSAAFLSGALLPIAPLLSGSLLAHLSLNSAQMILVGGFIVVAVVALWLPGGRLFESRPTTPQAPADEPAPPAALAPPP